MRTGCQRQVKAVPPGRTGGGGRGGRTAREATQAPHAAAENPQPGRQPALSYSTASPYIDKNPKAEQARAQAGAAESLRCGDPEVAGLPGHQLLALLLLCHDASFGQRGTLGGYWQASAPAQLLSILPDPQHSGWCPCTGCRWVGKCIGGMTPLSAEDSFRNLGRREGILFWSSGSLGC